MAAVVQLGGLDQVAVGQQHRVPSLVGAEGDRVDRHHVGAVQEVGDAAEALGLALREEAAARGVQARQRGVLLRRAGVADLQREVRIGDVIDDQFMAFLAEGHALAVDRIALNGGGVFAIEVEAQIRIHVVRAFQQDADGGRVFNLKGVSLTRVLGESPIDRIAHGDLACIFNRRRRRDAQRVFAFAFIAECSGFDDQHVTFSHFNRFDGGIERSVTAIVI